MPDGAPNTRSADGLGTLASSLVVVLVFLVVLSGLMAFGIRAGLAPTEAAGHSQPPGTPRPIANVGATPAPSDSPGTHSVRPGETLHSIASALGVSDSQLRYWNYDEYPSLLSNPQQVVVGWVLVTTGPPLPTATPGPTRPAEVAGRPPAETPLVALPELSVDVWNAAEVYHSIAGRNPAELLDATEVSAPPDCQGHAACAGPTTIEVSHEYISDPISGSCTLLGASVQVSYAAYLPRWTAPEYVPSDLLNWWLLVLEHIRWHEEQHIRIASEHLGRLDSLLAGQPCEAADTIEAALQAEMQSAQDAFDAQDRSWQLPPYSGPRDW